MQIQPISELKDQLYNIMQQYQNPNFELQRWNEAITVIATGSGQAAPEYWNGLELNVQFGTSIAGQQTTFVYQDGTTETVTHAISGANSNLLGVVIAWGTSNYILYFKKQPTFVFTWINPVSVTPSSGFPLRQYPNLYFGQLIGVPSSSANTYSTRFYDRNMFLVNTYQSMNEPHLFHTVTAASNLQVQFNGYLIVQHNQIRLPFNMPYIGAV